MRIAQNFKTGIISVLFAVILCPVSSFSQEGAESRKSVSEETFSILTEFLSYDRDLPLDVRIAEETDFENHTRKKIVFTSMNNERVPGYFAVPKEGTSPFPVVIYCHGGGGSKEWGWRKGDYLGAIVPKLISAGYAVLSLDAQHSGERLINNDFEPAYKYIVNNKWYVRERNMVFQTVIDYRRAIDFLSAQKEIDINRLGVDGFSFGSMVAYILTSVDSRIKTCTLSGLPVGTKSYNWESRILRKANYLPGIKNRPVLLQLGTNDSNISKPEVERFFKLLNRGSSDLIWYESGHVLPIAYQDRIVDWFEKYLK